MHSSGTFKCRRRYSRPVRALNSWPGLQKSQPPLRGTNTMERVPPSFPGLGQRSRRVVHHRSRRVSRRLRSALQGPVSRRLFDATSSDLAPGTKCQHCASSCFCSCWPRFTCRNVCAHRGHCSAELCRSTSIANSSGRSRTTWTRARTHRMGFSAVRKNCAPANNLSR